MDINNILDNQQILNYAIKGFGIIFSFMYLLFSIVIYKQSKVMIKTLQTKRASIIVTISLIQIFYSLFVFFYAVFFI